MTLADEINRMIKKMMESSIITSAGGDSPKTNKVIGIGEQDTPDLESLVREGASDDSIKEDKKLKDTVKKVNRFDKGNVGKVNRFTSAQFGNLQGFVENPATFIINKVFGKLAKGVGVIAFAFIIFEAVKFIIRELLKPGRLLDIRFKRDFKNELIAFRRREDQQKLRQGFANIIITSTPRLRLTAQNVGQVTNTFDLVRRNQFPENIGVNPVLIEAAGVSLSKSKGRRQFRR